MNSTVLIILILIAVTWLASTVGSALVVFFKRENNQMSSTILGFAAGVMLVAAFWHLLHPAFDIAEQHTPFEPVVVVTGGFLLGCFIILLLDMCLNRVKKRREHTNGGQGLRFKQSFMLVGSISLHKLPEGFAVGVLLGALCDCHMDEQLLALLPVLVALALHNLPEAAAVSISFRKEGLSRTKSFFTGQVPGVSELLSGIAGFLVVTNIAGVMPYAMSFAAGAMVWVVVHEIIPECQKNRGKNPYLATIGIVVGLALMIAMDALFCIK